MTEFANKFPELSNALDNLKNLTWREIEHKLLPAPKPEKAEILELPEGKYIDKTWTLSNNFQRVGKSAVTFARIARKYARKTLA